MQTNLKLFFIFQKSMCPWEVLDGSGKWKNDLSKLILQQWVSGRVIALGSIPD